MPLIDKRHRLLRTANGIHCAHAWDVTTLDDVSPSKLDEGKIARVATLEGELSIPEVSVWFLAFVDDSGDGIPPVPHWLRLDGDGSSGAVWPAYTVPEPSDIYGLEVSSSDVSKVARADSDGSYWVLANLIVDEGGTTQDWRRLDNVEDKSIVSWTIEPEGYPGSLEEIGPTPDDLHKVAFVPSGGDEGKYFVLSAVDSDGEGGYTATWRALDAVSAPAPASEPYTHVQGAPSATWSVVHNLGRYASVTIIDSTGAEVEGEIQHDSVNACTLSFSSAFSGRALCL